MVCSGVRVALEADPIAFTSLNSFAYFVLVSAFGPRVSTWAAFWRVNGRTLRTQPKGSFTNAGSSGRHWPGPGFAGTVNPGAPNRPSFALWASIAAAAAAPIAIPSVFDGPSVIEASVAPYAVSS